MKHVHNSKQLTRVNCNPLRMLLNSLRGSAQKILSWYFCVCVGESGAQPNILF